MKVAYFMVASYMISCARVRTLPCKYFQLNSRYFNPEEGIFSKLDIDQLIPREWRLEQYEDDGTREPDRFPVFVKPEWGQNARGIERADDAAELREIRERTRHQRVRYLIQEGAPESREYEVFALRDPLHPDRFTDLTVTEVRNDRERNPVNSIYNTDTEYVEITDRFSDEQRRTIWGYLRRIGDFAISRMSVRSESEKELLAGRFHVIEINLFAPMPIHMLDSRYDRRDTMQFVIDYMMKLALLTRHRDRSLPTRPVFTKTWFYNRRNPVVNFVRAHI